MAFLLIILLLCVSLLIRYNRVILLLIKILRHKPFPQNSKKTEQLTIEQQNALSAGLIIAEQHMFCWDSLESDARNSGKREQKYRLRTAWDVFSSESAADCLSSFGTLHKLIDVAIDIYLNIPKEQWQSCINDQVPEDYREIIMSYCASLNQASSMLIENKVAENQDELHQILLRGSIAWDLGRLVYIARASYVAGYIDKDQAWQSINSVLPTVKQYFANWKEFGQSYMLGRAVSRPDDVDYGLFGIYSLCTTSEESPWLKYPLNN
ncbi:hypothetical protein BGI40_08925 [Snodgrassella communis]|uniref:DUF1266 domain-containing protein n=1 Tax=Snodgrassella communis TaxID=2946699 RepID=A0A066TH79_9NEIS|nr:DUF1266 domain-containing protein [Snodgrassella communis]KDN11418.1 hypothetical protein SALWKB12_2280 [Snodgrassella communis]KDN11604.1 hypothetical protein SALWKB12_2100 [Snodgrassella communis]KDN13745.1 hypothetical protein SALWKB29_2219 [Snodgrassella communis]PIT09932.1 hypothetical protein BGI29_03795 [Snodgrassella communis]PIT27989.1 hypothetical protein BGI38_05320 [Snodgrassella communis]